MLRKIYFDNARKLLARSLPSPVVQAAHIEKDFEVDGNLTKAAWQKAHRVRLEYESRAYAARPEFSTTVRVLWSDEFLYVGYECPFTKLTTFDPPQLDKERIGLWDRDVVEAFIGTDLQNIKRYAEFQVAPTGEKLDSNLDFPKRDYAWSSRFHSAVKIDEQAKVWTCEMRIPLQALSESKPAPGTKWRLNLYRADHANKAFLAWSPTLTGTFHALEKFGVLDFVE